MVIPSNCGCSCSRYHHCCRRTTWHRKESWKYQCKACKRIDCKKVGSIHSNKSKRKTALVYKTKPVSIITFLTSQMTELWQLRRMWFKVGCLKIKRFSWTLEVALTSLINFNSLMIQKLQKNPYSWLFWAEDRKWGLIKLHQKNIQEKVRLLQSPKIDIRPPGI